jgi:hypothetical protein
MGKPHLILEIDDAEVVATLARRHRRGWQIAAVRRAEIAGAEGASLAMGITTALQGLDVQDAEVHLACSERRFVHFAVEVPRMTAPELQALILRECRRLASTDHNARMLWASRPAGLSDKGERWAVVALPDQAWQPIHNVLTRSGIEVTTVTSLEEAASQSAGPRLPERLLLLDLNQQRVRLAYLDRGAVVQRRRIPPQMGAGGDEGAETLATHLGVEVPRTLDYFANQSLATPAAIAMSPLLELDDAMRAVVAGDLPVHPLPAFPWPLPQGERQPGLPTQGILMALLADSAMSILDQTDKARRDRRPSVVAAAASTALIAGSLAGFVHLGERAQGVRLEAAAHVARTVALEQQAAELTARVEQRRPRPVDPDLAAVLGTRRPMSLLLARLCAAAPAGVGIRELRMHSQNGLLVLGQVSGDTRMDSLQRLGGFTSALQALPFLTDDRGNADLLPGNANSMLFEFQASWGGGR